MNSYFSKTTVLNSVLGALLLASGPLVAAQVTETITLTAAPAVVPQKQETKSRLAKVLTAAQYVVVPVGAATVLNATARLVSNNLPIAKIVKKADGTFQTIEPHAFYKLVHKYCRRINFGYDDVETSLTKRRLNLSK